MPDQIQKSFYRLSSIKIVLLCLLLIAIPCLKHRSIIFKSTEIEKFAQRYANSQYILGDAGEKISDSELYTYAGYAYVQGENPVQVNFEHPPLMKYLFGISFALTGNVLLINIPIFFSALVLFYLLAKKVISNENLAVLGVIIMGLTPLFFEQIKYSLLDVPLLLSVLIFFSLLFSNKIEDGKQHILLGLVLGIMASIKYPLPFVVIPVGFVLWHLWRKKQLKHFWLVLLPAVGVYLSQYIVYFLDGHSLLDWVRFEIYRFNWWTGDRTIPKFLILQNLFTGRHAAWWSPGEMLVTKEWNIFLPMMFVASFACLPHLKKNHHLCVLFLFNIITLILFALGSASALRYLLVLYPWWILQTLVGAHQFFTRKETA